MDLLDNYKKAWKNQPEEASKRSTIEIYKLAHSRSASIVKWIFIIGILEFVIFNALSFFMDIDKTNEKLNTHPRIQKRYKKDTNGIRLDTILRENDTTST